ncbi:MAG TPA: PKD domain-containing protein [Nocardioidaceae bacterium]|nr:PKD domain-containing protein [Nocardioidaceae bacterium]
MSFLRSRTQRMVAAGAAVLVTAALAVSPTTSADAATLFVSHDPAPGWQVDGTVYTSLIVGDTVYIGGSFVNAIAPDGTLVERKNIAAFRMSTGELVGSFDAAAGSTVRALATDGHALYVGGSFGRLGTTSRNYAGKVDLVTGVVDPSFDPQPDSSVRALVVEDGKVYLGGSFTHVDGQARNRLAKVSASSGALDGSFTAAANNIVYSLAMKSGADRLYVGGSFTAVNGVDRNGLAGVEVSTGAVAGPAFANSARPTYAVEVNEDGSRVFAAGGSATNSSAAWSTVDGSRRWRVVTDGDNQALTYYRGVVYIGFHDGYQGDASLKLLAVDASSGAVDASFRPEFDDFWGVWTIDISERGLVAGGDFTTVQNISTRGFALFPAVTEPPPPPPTSVSLVGPNSSWSYWDQGTRPTGWEQPGFNSTSWPSGPPRLGYGDTFVDTVVGYGPFASNKYLTTYFRAPFTLDELPDSLDLKVSVDDGAIAYLNGVEIGRENMPAGPVGNTTLASSDKSGGNETALLSMNAPTSLLQLGTNWLAVEVHQISKGSSDLGLDVDLNGLYEDAEPANQSPVAGFTASVNQLTATLDGSGSIDPDGEVVAYSWDFGDGTSATGPTVEHSYDATGDYSVVLSVLDDDGALGSISQTVSVESAVQILVTKGSSWRWTYPTAAPDPAWKSLSFSDTSWSLGSAPLGFGSPSVVSNIDTFASTSERPKAAYFRKTFTVNNPAKVSRLILETVADDGVAVYVNGTEVARANLPTGTITHSTYATAAPRTSKVVPLVIEVSPDLLVQGTNVVAAETHLNYRGTPDLSFDLSLTSESGNARPDPQFTWSTDDLTATLDATGSTDADGQITSYDWDFGDGTQGSGAQIAHTFASTGTYSVTLTVHDDDGASDSSTIDVTVSTADPVVVPFGSGWHWRYAAGAPPVLWNTLDFDAGTWALGLGVLGFGDTSVTTNIDTFATSSERPRAAYFVHRFSVTDVETVTRLLLDTVADDGAVIYVNGTEVSRMNMPTGTVSYLTYATAAPRTSSAPHLSIEVPVSLLVNGENVIAVETHLNYRATPDVTFDLHATLSRAT